MQNYIFLLKSKKARLFLGVFKIILLSLHSLFRNGEPIMGKSLTVSSL
ncbi:hypothetical protein HMPREF0653_00816 [Prevotella disiens JCM 6334 = ATCC 29426]|uniref:Uncharacterized protein n=1 Tax=Prevotella disiens JCM 6334 = ATCC 29426 TaxID=1235811 RepID=A0ABN0NTR7_9BACT|nr:hypothetical protein HMPREF0653_00816 [Prevotella disiens JCM 6334 = ATCC 29426]